MPSKPPAITKYIDPFTDFGFKRLFGTEPNKDLLIDLLNSIFNGRKHIADLEYNKNEHTADTKDEGSAIFDISCTGAEGERFVIEVQRGKQVNFKQRAIFYTSMLAAGLAPKGRRSEWGYGLQEIYLVALLEDFFIGPDNDGSYVQDIYLTNRRTGKVFYEGLGYIFLELVNFAKKEEELENSLDKWMYVLKNISKMDKIPVFLRKTIFEKVFSIAEYSNMTKKEKTMYNTALKYKWDNQNVLDYAVMTAKEEGIKEERAKAEAEKRQFFFQTEEEKRKILSQTEEEKRKILSENEEEKRQIALDLKKIGMATKDIARIVGLSTKEVEQL